MNQNQRSLFPEPLSRSVTLDRASIDETKRTVELSFSSELPVERWFGFEILDHNPESVNLSRLKSGAALLLDHNRNDQVGVVERAWIDSDRKGRATVRFGKSARAQEIFQDVVDGIRQLSSVTYEVRKYDLEKSDGETKTYRIRSWMPLEISIVSIPADPSVGVGRNISHTKSMNPNDNPPETPPGEQQRQQTPTPKTVDIVEVENRARQREFDRQREIRSLGKSHNCDETAEEYVEQNKPLEEFRRWILTERYKAAPVTAPDAGQIGMSKQEVKRYSLCRAILLSGDPGAKFDGLEKEASDAVAKLCKRNSSGFFIPQDVAGVSLEEARGINRAQKDSITARMAGIFGQFSRALNASSAPAGGFTIGTELLAGSMIELLRNKMIVSQLGARTLSGLVGNIAIPRVTGGATAFWLSEDGTATFTDQAFGQLGLVPHRLVAGTAFNKQLLAQSSIDVEALVRDDLMQVIAIEKDRACINGLGAAGEPLGILNTTGIGTVTYGGAATWSKVVESETTLADANADLGSIAWLTTPTVRGKWKTAVKVTNQAVFLWENNLVNGYPSHATKQVPGNKTIFANWNDLIMADWAGIDVVTDPFSRKKQGEIEVQITIMTDNGIRHATSFVVSTDSGAQ